MNAAIIVIGDEILIGTTQDTNSGWIARQLDELGINVYQIRVIHDRKEDIIGTLDDVIANADLVLITGGLGPTRDDITKKTLVEYYGSTLILDETIYKDIEAFFAARGKEMTETNKGQAEIPDNCVPLRNPQGTAPGMWFEKEGKVVVSLPGVPFEMKAMMKDEVVPRIKQKFETPKVAHKHILTVGIGESFLSDRIKENEDQLPEHIKLAYLPGLGTVKIRLTARGDDQSKINDQLIKEVEKLSKAIPEFIYGYEDDTLEGIVGMLLNDRKETVSTAESCTGGFIAHRITSVAGSSDYFKGSVVSYADEAKAQILHVDKDILETYGAVSEEVALQMAKGVRRSLNTDHSVAVTGIAGPTGGTEEKPVGTVWIAVANENNITTTKFLFGDDRRKNIELAATTALDLLRRWLLGQNAKI